MRSRISSAGLLIAVMFFLIACVEFSPPVRAKDKPALAATTHIAPLEAQVVMVNAVVSLNVKQEVNISRRDYIGVNSLDGKNREVAARARNGSKAMRLLLLNLYKYNWRDVNTHFVLRI